MILSIGAYFSYAAAFSDQKPASNHRRDVGMELLVQQNQLEREGTELEEAFQFEPAKEKFRQAIEIGKRMAPRQDYWRPTSFYVRVLQKEGKYDEAFKEMSRLSETAPENEHFSDKKKELETLVKARDLNNDSPIRQYIEFIKEKYAAGLPPKGYGGFGIIRITTIFRLYDAIGDYDAGIAYIGEIMTFLKLRKKGRGEDFQIYDQIKTTKDANACLQLGANKNPNWHGCKLIREYLFVREGFEQDKAEGRKSCINAKPGEICMGRATKALIQSDYFPW